MTNQEETRAKDAEEARAEKDVPDKGSEKRRVPNSGGSESGLQPGGTVPGAGPGTGVGSLGTGGGSTGGEPTGNAARTKR